MLAQFDLDLKPGRVRVAGEIDMSVADFFADRLRAAAMQAAPGGLVIDLSGVTFFNSIAVDALLEVIRRCPDTNFEIIPSHRVLPIFRLAGLLDGTWTNVEVRPDGDSPA